MALDERIEQLLDWWEELNEQGRRISPEQLCRDCPELVETVRRQLSILQATHWLEEPLDAPDSERQGNSQATTENEPQLTDRFQAGDEPVPGYRLVERLGRGGYGEVWKAIGPGNFPLAIKLVPLTAEAGPVELRALDAMREVRHPHLLSTFGAWQKENVLIIAMELADRTLLARLQEAVSQGHRGIPAQELVQHLEDGSEGIDFLNESCHGLEGQDTLGIQHRDIKPQNLLLVGGRVKVGDFGLARVLTHTVTGHTGSLTPAYAAPEFFNGQTFRQSDQYSLAVTYCHLRGGRVPFTGSPAQIMAGHLLRPPDLTMLPENERPAVMKALAKRPSDRWPSCRAFVAELAKAVRVNGQEADGKAVANTGKPQSENGTLEPTPGTWKAFISRLQQSGRRNRLPLAIVTGLLALAGMLAFMVQPTSVIYLVDMTPQNFDALAFEPWCNKTVHGKQTPHGLGLRPQDKSWAYVLYDLNKQFRVFMTTAGIADSPKDGGSNENAGPLTFTVIGDGRLLWQSQPLQKRGQVDACQVSVAGVSQLILQVHCPGSASYAEPVWVEPRLTGHHVASPDSSAIQDEADSYERAITLYVTNGEIDKAATIADKYAFLQGDDVTLLLGTWTAEVGPGHVAEWTFRADGTVASTKRPPRGRWKKEKHRVVIDWEAPGAWDALDLPLNPNQSHGATSLGSGLRVTAAKVQPTEVVTLLGTWSTVTGWFPSEWTFLADGKVNAATGVPTGKWKFEKQNKRILISWDLPNAWESLNLPLSRKGTDGDSFHGKDIHVKAVKLYDSWPEQFVWSTPATFLVDLTPRHFEAFAFGPSPDTVLNGKQTLHGLGLHPPKNGRGYAIYGLNKRFRLFRTMAAIRNSANGGGGSASPLTFNVIGDGKLLWQSQPLQRGGQVDACEVPVSGLSELVLQVDCPGSSDFAHAIWIEPSLYQ